MSALKNLFQYCSNCQDKLCVDAGKIDCDDEVSIDEIYHAKGLCISKFIQQDGSQKGKRKDCRSLLCQNCASVEIAESLGWTDVVEGVDENGQVLVLGKCSSH